MTPPASSSDAGAISASRSSSPSSLSQPRSLDRSTSYSNTTGSSPGSSSRQSNSAHRPAPLLDSTQSSDNTDPRIDPPKCSPDVNPRWRDLHFPKMSMNRFFQQPWNVQWQTALVRLPRAVPTAVLKYTSPVGPHPFIVNLPSREHKRKIPVYVFIPSPQHIEAAEAPGIVKENEIALPVILDFHGGGFYMGSALEQAPWCAKLARELGAVVLSVDYRMGPIDKFPAAHEDAEDVMAAVMDETETAPGSKDLREAVKRKVITDQKAYKKSTSVEVRLDTTRIASSGFSSGGNLTLNLGISTEGFDPKTYGKQTAPTPTNPTEWATKIPQNQRRTVPLLIYYPSLDCRALPSERPLPAILQKKKSNQSIQSTASGRSTKSNRSRKSSNEKEKSPKRPSNKSRPSFRRTVSNTLRKSRSSSNMRGSSDSTSSNEGSGLSRTITTSQLDTRPSTGSRLRNTITRNNRLDPSSASNTPPMGTGSPESTRPTSASSSHNTSPTEHNVNGTDNGNTNGHSNSIVTPQTFSDKRSAQTITPKDAVEAARQSAKLAPETVEKALANPAAAPQGFWSTLNDTLYSSYLPREYASHPRASPGLCPISNIHPATRMHLVLSERDALAIQGEEWVERIRESGDAERLAALKVDWGKGMKHGWTQMPEGMLKEEERKERDRVWDNSVQFVRDCWATEL